MRISLWISLLMIGVAAAEPLPSIGAIRWDGWFEGNPWEKNLASAEWAYRLPFFANPKEGTGPVICEDSQAVMDREIAYAKAGGLSYWAFCYYHPKSWPKADAYNYGWRRYLASVHKKDLHFCLLLQGGSHLGPADEWKDTVGEFVQLFKEPTYQRVCGNRPLLYVYACEKLVTHFGSREAAGDAFKLLRAESQEAGAGDPYIVAQVWPNQLREDFFDAIRFDAVGAYSAQGDKGDAQPYAKLVESNRWYWNEYKRTGRKVVPTVNAGWDGRPRKYTGAWYAQATPAEIADAVRQAFDWVGANAESVPARTVLVYAWNEFDEGGWLCPTLEEGPARLDAIRVMLDGYAVKKGQVHLAE